MCQNIDSDQHLLVISFRVNEYAATNRIASEMWSSPWISSATGRFRGWTSTQMYSYSKYSEFLKSLQDHYQRHQRAQLWVLCDHIMYMISEVLVLEYQSAEHGVIMLRASTLPWQPAVCILRPKTVKEPQIMSSDSNMNHAINHRGLVCRTKAHLNEGWIKQKDVRCVQLW